MTEQQIRQTVAAMRDAIGYLGVDLVNQSLDSFPHPTITEDQICNSDAVVIIHISGKRGQSAVGHADGDRRHVLEIIRHGEQKDVHKASL